MRLPSVVLALTACLVVACSRSEDSEKAAAPEPNAPAAAGAVQVAARNLGYDYVCAGGLSFNARIDKGNALLTLEGKTLTLPPVAGAFGAQYAGDDLLFIARGDEAMLTRGNGPLMTCKAK
jgi:membrane-bound inhibitor of C-type lysozyme